MQDYKIKLDAFEGPMDLLMHLIEKNKIDIYDIPIAELTQQYMDYLDASREFNIEIASEFLVMAATLLQIKSRMMLPKPPKEELEDEEDPRLELVQRILEYRRFKQVSSVLSTMALSEERYVARMPLELPVHRLPPENLSVRLLLEAFRTVLEVKEELTIPDALVQPETFHVRDKMEDILSLLSRAQGKLLFSEAFRSGTRSELIVTFLALLELMKRRLVTVRQQRSFSEIYITAREKIGGEILG
ncbi:MAG: segregation/condensation protein A [Selenomonadaceae bacterium]|nr:segregation/condensation protein A [Selenomonadaceae bacterium]MBR6711223.1 segregation/condensation protein A [Selenomonadaceae bacterium]MBR6905629.1 segregation/condensation protein A [Selenomonadaceae bacterium]